jgi:hypothetical protein
MPKIDKDISLEVLGTYETGILDDSAAEIVAYYPASQQLVVITACCSRGTTWLITANKADGGEYMFDADSEDDCSNPEWVFDEGECITHTDEGRIGDTVQDSASNQDGLCRHRQGPNRLR